MVKPFSLGRGLGSLIPSKKEPSDQPVKPSTWSAAPLPGNPAKGMVLQLPVEEIDANPYQPRTDFTSVELEELAQSIKERGIIQPLLVSGPVNNRYQLIAGERRWRAAKLAGLQAVPVLVKEVKDNQAKLALALVENIQRQDLNPIEEAKAYARLAQEFDYTQEQIAQEMGKSRAGVANTLRLLTLPGEIQKGLSENKITAGHAKVILGLPTTAEQLRVFKQIVEAGSTVREAEGMVRQVAVRPGVKTLSPELKKTEEDLRRRYNLKVTIKQSGKTGTVSFHYFSLEELKDLFGKLLK